MDVLCREFPEMPATVVNHYLDRCNGNINFARARLIEAQSECSGSLIATPSNVRTATSPGHNRRVTPPSATPPSSAVPYAGHIPGVAVPSVDYSRQSHQAVQGASIISPNRTAGIPTTSPRMLAGIPVASPVTPAHSAGNSSQGFSPYTPANHGIHVAAAWPSQLPPYSADDPAKGIARADQQRRLPVADQQRRLPVSPASSASPVSYASSGHPHYQGGLGQIQSPPGNAAASSALPRLTMPGQAVPMTQVGPGQGQPGQHGFPAAQFVPPWTVASNGQPSSSTWTGGQSAQTRPSRTSSSIATPAGSYVQAATPTPVPSSSGGHESPFTPIIPAHMAVPPYVGNLPAVSKVTSGNAVTEEPLPGTSDRAYTKALVTHQRDRLDRIQREVEHLRAALQVVQNDIEAKQMSHSSFVRSNSAFPTEDQLYMTEVEKSTLALDVQDLKSRLNSIGVSKSPSPGGEEEKWPCKNCTFLNHPAMTRCECCEVERT